MKLKLFTLTFDPDRKTFDDAELTAFLDDKEAVSASEHFFVHEHTPVLAVMVQYRNLRRPGDARPEREPPKEWRAELDEPARAVYDALRSWRAQAARRDGVAPYLICTNRQLADISRARPDSQASLLRIEGFGEGKAKRWGAELLAVLSATSPQPLSMNGEGLPAASPLSIDGEGDQGGEVSPGPEGDVHAG